MLLPLPCSVIFVGIFINIDNLIYANVMLSPEPSPLMNCKRSKQYCLSYLSLTSKYFPYVWKIYFSVNSNRLLVFAFLNIYNNQIYLRYLKSMGRARFQFLGGPGGNDSVGRVYHLCYIGGGFRGCWVYLSSTTST